MQVYTVVLTTFFILMPILFLEWAIQAAKLHEPFEVALLIFGALLTGFLGILGLGLLYPTLGG